MSGSPRLHIQAFSPTQASPVPGAGSAPRQQLGLFGVTNIPVKHIHWDRALSARGMRLGVAPLPLQVDLGTGVTLNIGICESAALHKLG